MLLLSLSCMKHSSHILVWLGVTFWLGMFLVVYDIRLMSSVRSPTMCRMLFEYKFRRVMKIPIAPSHDFLPKIEETIIIMWRGDDFQ